MDIQQNSFVGSRQIFFCVWKRIIVYISTRVDLLNLGHVLFKIFKNCYVAKIQKSSKSKSTRNLMKIRFRELSKFGLWDKSQWAVMSKLAEAINQDVRIILELVRDNARISESVKRDRDNTVKRLQVDMKNKITEVDMLKVKNAEFQHQIKNGKTSFL